MKKKFIKDANAKKNVATNPPKKGGVSVDWKNKVNNQNDNKGKQIKQSKKQGKKK